MEKQIIFRDYQEQQAQDHNDLQEFARTSFDHLVLDAVTATRRYAGFSVQKTAQAEVQIAPGRFYDVLGAVYHRDTTLVQSMITYLPAVAKRIVLISVYGSETNTDVEERDFLVDVDTGRTEPDAVATVRSRDAVLALTAGAESADPQAPSLPISHAPIAYVLLDTTQVVSVTMQSAYQVASTEVLDTRADALEVFKNQIEPRVSSLASDLAALAGRIGQGSDSRQISLVRIYQDIALLKTKADLPQAYSDYGADYYTTPDYSDTGNVAQLGYDCKIGDGGLSFATANADISEVALYSANDPNVVQTNGLVLPAYSSVLKLFTGEKTSEVSISQYGYQTFDLVQHQMTKYRLRYGPWWGWRGPIWPYWYYYVWGLFPGWTWAAFYPWILGYPYVWNYYWYGYWPYYWVESYTEAYWELEKTDHTIEGAQIAQTFLIANDTWVTKLGFYITAKGAQENIFLTLCEVTLGQPDLTKVIMHMTYDEADIVVGWNRVNIQPTFMKTGSRYALVFTSNANHKVGMTSGESYIDGTFFYSTDGAYYLGDLTKDMMIEIWGARFTNPQAVVEFAPINLDGGIRAIDLSASVVVPNSTQLVYEIRPSGAGDWIPLSADSVDALTNAPPLFQFRGRFIGTRDMAAAFLTTGSRLEVSRPKTTFRHVSTMFTLATPSEDFTVQLTLHNYDETPHDCTLHIWNGSGAAYVEPTSTVSETLDAEAKTVRKRFHFSALSPHISAFRIEINGSTNSAANLFTVGEMLFWSETV